MSKKILGIIPARYASTRFPGKPLADICGKSMIQCVYERALKAKSLCGVLIATDDEKIFNVVKNFGGQAVMTDSNLPNGTARCEQAAKIYNENIDAVINIQGDEPLLDPLMIDEVAELLNECECATLCSELENDFSNPNIVKVVISQNNYALYFSRSLIPYERNKLILPIYQHIGIYGYSFEFLKKYVTLHPTPLSEAESLEQLKILEHGYKIKIKATKSKNKSLGVDTPEDLEKVREIINACI
ncbi:MAG: 3-deoxy-manno-octulosonate cytidylyltransferase [Synergistales bacterium]|nr:3-deoxy-manno-octulosonate cytidylyltransferase [Synergistales bacterium]MDY6401988.1 3-deoxy-manno-octulosonate cytidylyltransferase [Synergistales bacterium]MDY6405159.1 3-deoxy-manno-octulosonate cytidylyltransferase [Synergistales bacterium]MDY6409706.1 3-deoxy-manno-octulosonate cytidylyltransferase [Synergistales bacterium]MDY6414062.1 3-deoxy-manno-octulosonate cytidylyltransferase [Synergistales bacterium]